MKNKSLGIINVIMPRSTHDSISSYYSQKERYYAHNVQTIKKEKPALTPRKSYKKQMENSRLLFVARGGQCVILGLIYPFYLILFAWPSWVVAKILPKSARFIRGIASKIASLIVSPFLKGWNLACRLIEKVMLICMNVFIRPFVKIGERVIRLKKGISFNPLRFLNKLNDKVACFFDKFKEIPSRFGAALVQKGKIFRKVLLNLIFAPKRSLIKLSHSFKKIGIKISKWGESVLTLKRFLVFPQIKIIKLKPLKFKEKFTFKINWPKIQLPKWKGINIPSFPAIPTIKIPKVLEKIPKFSPSFTLKMPKIKFDVFLKLIPKRGFNFGKWKFFNLTPLLTILRKGKAQLSSIVKRVNTPFSWVFSFLEKALKSVFNFFAVVVSGLFLLFGFWNEQVKEWIAKKLEG